MDKRRDPFFLPGKKQKKEVNGDKEARNDKKKHFNKDKRQNEFNKNRAGLEEAAQNGDKPEKKPFDKKTYRLKKYSKKYKLEQWEEQRKKKLLRDFYKDVKQDSVAGQYKAKSFDEDTTDGNQVAGRFVRHPDLIEKEQTTQKENDIAKKDLYFRAKEKYNKIKQEKLEKKQQIEKAREEKKQKLQEYKKKKQERFKKLSKKTKKGQPMMTGRLELLLDKIQKG